MRFTHVALMRFETIPLQSFAKYVGINGKVKWSISISKTFVQDRLVGTTFGVCAVASSFPHPQHTVTKNYSCPANLTLACQT